MGSFLVILYMVLGYWAAGQTIYANMIRIGSWDKLFLNRLVMGFILGWILIPIAFIKLSLAK